jgi:hypothetical protein
LLRRLHSCNGSEARGLFVLLTVEEAFDHALATAYAARMRHGRNWSGYCLPAPLIPSKSPSDLAHFEADLSDSDQQRPDWQVTQAKLKIDFYPEWKGKRAKTINMELRVPNGSNLKDQTRRHQIGSEKYLARAGG